MSRKNDESPKTSRRHFTKAAITAAAAASLAACRNQDTNSNKAPAQREEECPAKITVTPNYTEFVYGPGPVGGEDHIPPMGLEGGGSVIIDFKYDLKQDGSGIGPYTYMEDGVEPKNQYGNMTGALVIAETDGGMFLTKTEYDKFPPGTQLWLWYQPLKDNGTGYDYDDLPATLPDPDVAIRGGRTGEPFRVFVRKKKLQRDKSHKKSRPFRLRHTGGDSMPDHFRIGLWRFVKDNGTTTIVEGKGAENYNFYIYFDHFKLT